MTGSLPVTNTIGTVVVTALATSADGVFPTIKTTCRRTKSATRTGNRSARFSAERYSISTFWPSMKPASLRPWPNAAVRCVASASEVLRTNPITGIADCCARAASGQAAAPPSSVMNWRRPKSSMGSSPEPAVPAYRRLTMPRKRPQVLGLDLNRSESSRWARHRRALWNVGRGSLRLDVGCPEYFSPLLGLRRHIGAELRGGEDHRRGGRIGEPRLDDRVCEPVINLAIEPLDDLVGCTPRDANTLPCARLKARHDVAYRRDVG